MQNSNVTHDGVVDEYNRQYRSTRICVYVCQSDSGRKLANYLGSRRLRNRSIYVRLPPSLVPVPVPVPFLFTFHLPLMRLHHFDPLTFGFPDEVAKRMRQADSREQSGVGDASGNPDRVQSGWISDLREGKEIA